MKRPFYIDSDEVQVYSRDINEFMGIACILARKPKLDADDLTYVDEWLSANTRVYSQPVFAPILHLLHQSNPLYLSSAAGLDELHQLLRALSGDSDNDGKPDSSTSIAFDHPPPQIVFPNRRFCFTGTFKYGGRLKCEAAVTKLGACAGELVISTDYLVVGSIATETWRHSTFGRKVTQARKWQEKEVSEVKIVSEEYWLRCMLDNPRQKAENTVAKHPSSSPQNTDTLATQAQTRGSHSAAVSEAAPEDRDALWLGLGMILMLFVLAFGFGWALGD